MLHCNSHKRDGWGGKAPKNPFYTAHIYYAKPYLCSIYHIYLEIHNISLGERFLYVFCEIRYMAVTHTDNTPRRVNSTTDNSRNTQLKFSSMQNFIKVCHFEIEPHNKRLQKFQDECIHQQNMKLELLGEKIQKKASFFVFAGFR